ncbi:hypothetical protein L665_00953 [Ralstonia solanacearum SD54]|nr:hypothetical protein L665_00953 [Ralstonia solanacearum SD54]
MPKKVSKAPASTILQHTPSMASLVDWSTCMAITPIEPTPPVRETNTRDAALASA